MVTGALMDNCGQFIKIMLTNCNKPKHAVEVSAKVFLLRLAGGGDDHRALAK